MLYAASRELLSFLLRQPRSMVHALTVVKSTLCVKQRAAGGGRSDYYSKPLNEFKNSYFGAFAIQSLCLGLMQKMPFAFLLRGALSVCVCVCVCVCAHRCARRITATANLYDIPLHYYHSRSPVQLIIAGDVWDVNLQCNVCTVCSALLGKKKTKKRKSASTLYRTVGRRSDAAQIPPAVPTLPSEALVCFHDATCSAAGRVAEPCLLRVKDTA